MHPIRPLVLFGWSVQPSVCSLVRLFYCWAITAFKSTELTQTLSLVVPFRFKKTCKYISSLDSTQWLPNWIQSLVHTPLPSASLLVQTAGRPTPEIFLKPLVVLCMPQPPEVIRVISARSDLIAEDNFSSVIEIQGKYFYSYYCYIFCNRTILNQRRLNNINDYKNIKTLLRLHFKFVTCPQSYCTVMQRILQH